MAGNYAHRKKANVKGPEPGYNNKVYIALVSSFTAIAAAVGVDGADLHTIADDHTFPVGSGFYEIFTVKKSNTVTSEMKGDPGAAYLVHKVSFGIPGDDPALISMMEALCNEDVIILIGDLNQPANTMIQIGSEAHPVNLESNKFDGSKHMSGSSKMWTVEGSSNSRAEYQGTITLKV